MHIEGHARHENYLKLQIPIHEWHAYDVSDYSDGAEEVTVGHVHFEITYLNEDQIFFVDKTGEEGYVQVAGYPLEKLLSTHRLEQAVRVLLRPADFDRFSL